MEMKLSFPEFESLTLGRDFESGGDILEYLHLTLVVIPRPSKEQQALRVDLLTTLLDSEQFNGCRIAPAYKGFKFESELLGESFIVPDIVVLNGENIVAVTFIVTPMTNWDELHYKILAVTSSGCRFIYIADMSNRCLDIYDSVLNTRCHKAIKGDYKSWRKLCYLGDYLNPFAI